MALCFWLYVDNIDIIKASHRISSLFVGGKGPGSVILQSTESE